MNFLKKINSFRGYTKVGLASNLSFIIFIIITMIYYSYYLHTGKILPVVEIIAYSIEIIGFMLMILAAIGYCVKLRFRLSLKIAMVLYFLVEFIIMICDFHLIDAEEFYSPASKGLIIFHCVFSAIVAMFYMQLDSQKNCMQVSAAVTAVIMMLASFSIVFEVRVYASVLVNSFAYVFMYGSVLFYDKREMIDVDCHGDVAKVYEYNGFFEDDDKK